MKVEIRYPRFEYRFGRNIAFGQLFNVQDGHLLINGTIAEILQKINDSDDVTLVNAQDILDLIVRQNGFAS